MAAVNYRRIGLVRGVTSLKLGRWMMN